ncbi:uncharacterized protein LOC106646267 isoform X2 [Copidosoma floridanum]|uniref:uncharacterized protein LOC106646267 isoform X2 n=1 Tax=Copidosoma floridanum TaxID=29053 RepID=UPI0006C971A5|nr:uncharacterized protein LOC106646267 isoform X2 [Copidosoma floridanum]
MKDLDPKIIAWLQDHLIPRLAGVFGEECANVDECKVTRPKGSFFLSDLFFATIRLRGAPVERCLLVKLPAQDPNVRKRQNYNYLFSNEILFYQRLAAGSSDYPQCYFCGEVPVFDKVIVLENVCSRGYSVCPDKFDLQQDYLAAGLRSLARFHGRTYTLKELRPAKFREIVGGIINIRYDPLDERKTAVYAKNVNKRVARVSRALTRSTRLVSEEDRVFTAEVARLLENCHSNVMMRSVEPREPLATIVHGDCTVNNMLFRWSESLARREAMLVDFALVMYSSPATDVSTFLYMSASRLDLKTRFRELFQIYHGELAQYLKDQKIWDPVKYSYEAFVEDFKKSAILGYVISIFFLPIMTEYAKNNDLLDDVDEAIERLNITGGGEPLTDRLVDTLIDMREAGLLDYYVTCNPTGR